MKDYSIDIKLISTSLEGIADDIGVLHHIEDEISKLASDIRDLNNSLCYLTDKIGELKK